MWETWVPSLGQEDPREKETATHPSILAWRTPWTEDLVGCTPQGYKELDITERLSLFLFSSVYFHKCVDFPVFLPLLKLNFILLQVREDTLY